MQVSAGSLVHMASSGVTLARLAHKAKPVAAKPAALVARFRAGNRFAPQ
ncbi:hypothetical protein SAMN00120144_2266 [Hymenobacter roseosalivarius DSM 11622]|uniref:Uncharacterized protein n=1 Tax=Hymenobacter roseosalivarius DSM 11622 TaxID=645990 RepID=A0A1W1VXC8_9BACT|nr:hypothetical protein SAMN00120144_2266 [Hymenobacter roseosalivarius DSM 11622]